MVSNIQILDPTDPNVKKKLTPKMLAQFVQWGLTVPTSPNAGGRSPIVSGQQHTTLPSLRGISNQSGALAANIIPRPVPTAPLKEASSTGEFQLIID